MPAIRTVGPLLATALLLVGCNYSAPGPSSDQDSANAAAGPAHPANAVVPADVVQATPDLSIESEGLRLFMRPSGSARAIAFGTARADVIRVLAFRGPFESGTMEECGAGPIDYAAWPDGLKLHFQQGKFVGWAVTDRATGQDAGSFATVAGIGPGSTRAELEDAYSAEVRETTLGIEFSAGALFGVLDGDKASSRITDMWAGESCNFR